MKASSDERSGADLRQQALDHFTEACAQDERVVTAFLGGSLAAGTHDAYSDLDIYAVVDDDAYDSFFAERHDFLGKLGEPVFLEDRNMFGLDMVLFLFRDRVHGELALGRRSGFLHRHGGPFRTLVDKAGLLEGVSFPLYRVPEQERKANVHGLIYGLWRDALWFRKALGRGFVREASAWLEKMRYATVKLACIQAGGETGTEGYNTAERMLPQALKAEIQDTWCLPENEPRSWGAAADRARRHGLV
jgi:predicted nucleotidyltransferase